MGERAISTTRQQALRIVDANANRAGEGLRTLEDIARLVNEDASVAEWVKALRHRLGDALALLPRRERLAARSTEGDAGTELTAAAEERRIDLSEVVTSACERITQALRQLEEFGKLLSPDFAARIKQVRYEAYDALATVELRLNRSANPFARARLYLLLDCRLPLPEFANYVARLAAAGVDAFQIRDKHADGGRLLAYARAMKDSLADGDALSIVNDRVDVALAAGVDAVHVGQDDLPCDETRRLAGAHLQIGVSTHDVEQALAAARAGADYIGCGPTFPSGTKQFEQFAGTAFLRQVAGAINLPCFAIGGIHLGNLDEVIAAGCRRIAVSGAIHDANDPCEVAANIKSRLVGNA